jgi:hypothetical protein
LHAAKVRVAAASRPSARYLSVTFIELIRLRNQK